MCNQAKHPILQQIYFAKKRVVAYVSLIDRIVSVCCALTNVCNSIVPFARFFLENKFRRGKLKFSNIEGGRILNQAVD